MDSSPARHHDHQHQVHQNQPNPNPHPHHHHALSCVNNNNNTHGGPSNPPGSLALGTSNGVTGPSLPHQLSQLCSAQQYPLSALQQNFNHLMPQNYPDLQRFNSQTQHQESLAKNFYQRNTGASNHHHFDHHHHNHDYHASSHHHQRSHTNWRKNKAQSYSRGLKSNTGGKPHSLLDLSAKIVAEHIPFQTIEQKYEHIPEPVQRRIIFWSFPRHEDDIKMYSSLSSDTFIVNGPSTSSTSTSSPASSTSANNTIHSSPSSNSAYAWAEQANIQINPIQANNNHTTANLRNNTKQLTFHKGLRLHNDGCVQDVLQVGFNLSGLVVVRSNPSNPPATASSKVRNSSQQAHNNSNNASNNLSNNDIISNQPSVSASSESTGEVSCTRSLRVSVTFDRCKITSVSCSCELKDIFWCEHVVALILYRIRNPETIDLRVPISETLLSLDRQQLQKLVQYIIAEHHTEVLPTAQRLLDEMRQSFSEINQIQGAPDPTAGACADDEHIWHLDENQVNEKVQNYLSSVSSNSKEACKQINALFEKIREMFRAKDSNGTRLLKLITQQFLIHATRNEKSRPLWDQLVSFWVVVMLNPDLSKVEKAHFINLLGGWCKVPKCPKEDVERKTAHKRKAAELSDDEDTDEYSPNPCPSDYLTSFNQSNNYPAHMATHRRNFSTSNNHASVLRPYNQLSILPSACPCQIPHFATKKMKINGQQPNDYNGPSSSISQRAPTNNHPATSRSSGLVPSAIDNRPVGPQEPKSVFQRALDYQESSWEDHHLQLILNKDGPVDVSSIKSHFVDFAGNPLWHESVSHAAARVETLRSHGYKEQALRLTVATVRRLKLHQDQWCISVASEPGPKGPTFAENLDVFSEGWIGHPFDPINVMLDVLLDASKTEPINSTFTANGAINGNVNSSNLCALNNTRCSCPYNQALVDFTHRLLPDLASFSYQNRLDGFSILPFVGLGPRRSGPTQTQSNADKTTYYHVPVPGCCQKDSYLTLGIELALIALGQQRSIPTIATAHERAVRQEADLISKLEAIDTSDPLLIDILKHQTTLLLEGGPFQSTQSGMLTDCSPLHTFARYLFDSLVAHYPQLAYKIGVYALKMPLLSDENGENVTAPRGSPRNINFNHLQSEQLSLAQTMLSRAKDDSQQGGFLRKVYRASVKNIRNPTSLLKLSKHVLKEAKPSGTTLYPSLLKTAFDLGLQVLKLTLLPHSSNSKARREAILFIVECATDMGLESVLLVMREAKEHFSAIEALNLVASRDNDQVNIKSQALSKLKLKESPVREDELNQLNRKSRDLALDSATRDPANCALEALKFCEVDEESLKRALKIVIEAGTSGTMDSSQLIKVADHIHERGLTDKAFDLAMVAVETLSIPSNSDNSTSKKDIFSACEYAQKVNGFSTLIPKLINNIECATVLSEIYHRFSPNPIMAQYNRGYPNDLMAYRQSLNYSKGYNELLNNYTQKIEDAGWWDALLKRTIDAFIQTTRNRLQNISPRHYGEFIDFLVKAQGTFEKATDGPQRFKDLIAEIIKSYRTKKKLMERLKERFDPTYISNKLQSSVTGVSVNH